MGSLVKSFLTSHLQISYSNTRPQRWGAVPLEFRVVELIFFQQQRKNSTMAATLCQVMGFILSLLGAAGIIAATGMDQWATEDLFDNPVTAVYSYSGLWRSCVRQSSGFTECRPYFTILGLPGMFIVVNGNTESTSTGWAGLMNPQGQISEKEKSSNVTFLPNLQNLQNVLICIILGVLVNNWGKK